LLQYSSGVADLPADALLFVNAFTNGGYRSAAFSAAAVAAGRMN
jgi:hypothetical protein